jgi:hypothetical protein
MATEGHRNAEKQEPKLDEEAEMDKELYDIKQRWRSSK